MTYISKPMTPAERMYEQHKRNVSRYQKGNPDMMKAKQKRYVEKLRLDPDRYHAHLEKRRQYYMNVVKPRANADACHDLT